MNGTRRVRDRAGTQPAIHNPEEDVGAIVAARVYFDLLNAIKHEADVDRERAAEITDVALDAVGDVVNAAVKEVSAEAQLLDQLYAAVCTADDLGLDELSAEISTLYQRAGKATLDVDLEEIEIAERDGDVEAPPWTGGDATDGE